MRPAVSPSLSPRVSQCVPEKNPDILLRYFRHATVKLKKKTSTIRIRWTNLFLFVLYVHMQARREKLESVYDGHASLPFLHEVFFFAHSLHPSPQTFFSLSLSLLKKSSLQEKEGERESLKGPAITPSFLKTPSGETGKKMATLGPEKILATSL